MPEHLPESTTQPDSAIRSSIGDQIQRLLLGVKARVFRQQRRVDVQHPPGEAIDETGRQDAHEAGERDQLLVAKDLDSTRPSIWNNLANYYGHRGDVRTAFDYYQKAIDLDPNESVYYHNFGTTVYLFRRDAEEPSPCRSRPSPRLPIPFLPLCSCPVPVHRRARVRDPGDRRPAHGTRGTAHTGEHCGRCDGCVVKGPVPEFSPP